MTVTIATPVWEDAETFTISWSSDLGSPTYYVYKDGELVTMTVSEFMRFYVAPGEQPMIEVLDTTDAPDYARPGRVWLAWYPDTTASYYLVEEAPQGVYSEVARVSEIGLGYYRYLTKWLSDGYAGNWRVTPVDDAGNAGTPLVFAVVQVRHPDVPNVTYTYDPTTAKVTINSVGDGGIIDMAGETENIPSTGSGAISETIAAGAAKDFIETRLTIVGDTADLSDLEVTIGPPAALTTASIVYVPTAGAATDVAQVINRFATPAFVDDDQTINVTWPNTLGKTWELQIIYELK